MSWELEEIHREWVGAGLLYKVPGMKPLCWRYLKDLRRAGGEREDKEYFEYRNNEVCTADFLILYYLRLRKTFRIIWLSKIHRNDQFPAFLQLQSNFCMWWGVLQHPTHESCASGDNDSRIYVPTI